MRQGSGEIVFEALRLFMGMALLILVTGIWVCLWVPPTM